MHYLDDRQLSYRQIQRQIDKQIDRQTFRQIDREIEGQIWKNKYIIGYRQIVLKSTIIFLFTCVVRILYIYTYKIRKINYLPKTHVYSKMLDKEQFDFNF